MNITILLSCSTQADQLTLKGHLLLKGGPMLLICNTEYKYLLYFYNAELCFSMVSCTYCGPY